MREALVQALRTFERIDDADLIPVEAAIRRALAGTADIRLTLRLALRAASWIDDPDLIPVERHIRRALGEDIQVACDIMEIIDACCF